MSEPTWELLGGGGVLGGPIDYVGDWAAGTTYQPGQVVRYAGIDYLAVNPSTGQTPPAPASLTRLGAISLSTSVPGNDCNQAVENGWYAIQASTANAPPGGFYWALFVMTINISGNVRQFAYRYLADTIYMRRRDDGVWGAWQQIFPTAYATTLPASPVDGQEVILVDSISAPTYQWCFRYNAGSSSGFKWEFIGGVPIVVNPVGVSVSNTGAAYVDTTATITLPRAGIYIIQGHARAGLNVTNAGARLYLGLSIGGSVVHESLQNSWFASSNDASEVNLIIPPYKTGSVSAGTIAKLQFHHNQAATTTMYLSYPSMTATPVQVS